VRIALEEHRFPLIERLVTYALDLGSHDYEAEAWLVSDFFLGRGAMGSVHRFEGFMPMAHLLAIDFPKVFYYIAMMLKGAGFENEPKWLQPLFLGSFHDQ
jgi:translation initiation factor 4G